MHLISTKIKCLLFSNVLKLGRQICPFSSKQNPEKTWFSIGNSKKSISQQVLQPVFVIS